MSAATIQEQAEKIAARVDSQAVGFDPATIIAIFSTVLPLIMQCFGRNDEPDPQQVSAAVKTQHERNPVALRRKTARRIRAEADEPMTKLQSFDLADAMIAEALEAKPETVAALAVACGV